MITLNDVFRIHDRSGGVLITISDEHFWATTGTTLYHFDPRVLYDPFGARWIIIEAYRSYATSAAGFALAVSTTADPTGTWNRYALAAPPGAWYDFPMVGFNESAITVTVNSIAANNSASIIVYVIDKPSLYAGTGSFTYDYITAPAGTMTPVSAYDPNTTTSYLVETLYGQNSVRLYRAQQGTLYSIGTITSPQTWSEYTPLLPQLGSTTKISPGDTRVTNAVLRNGALWFPQTVFLPVSSATRSAIQWWKVSPYGQLLDWGRIDDSSGSVSYCFPSLAVNRNDDVVIGFSEISASAYPSAAYACRTATDAAGTFRAPVGLKTGQSPYDDMRWGDYSATAIDPDDLTFWTLQQYAASNFGSAQWGVWWGHVPSVGIGVAVPQNLAAAASGASPVNVTWLAAASIDHYELLRSTNGAAFVVIATPFTTSFLDSAISANTVYLYRVRAVASSGAVSAPSNTDLASTFVFSDDPLTAFSTAVKAAHFAELRAAIDSVRTVAGLEAYPWTDNSLSHLVIKVVHVTELREALDTARVNLGLRALSYSDPTITPKVTHIRAVHIGQIRNGLR